MDQFTVKHEDGGFTDISNKLSDFLRDSSLLQMKVTSKLHIGFRKPFNFFFNSFIVANTVVNKFTVQYHNLTSDALTDIPNLNDTTEGYTRDGFITFDRPTLNSQASTDWKAIEIDGVELYWITITTDTEHDVLTDINGIGILFSSEEDLQEERRNITSKHAVNERTKTWVDKHQAARKEIVQEIRNQGGSRIIKSNGALEPTTVTDINEFSFHNLDQIRQASKWLTLSKIFMNELSDAADDKWMKLGEKFEENYTNAFDVFMLSLDLDDDGEEDPEEVQEDVKRISLSFT